MFEKDVHRQILEWLNQQPYTIAQAAAFSMKGIPDILCCIKGKFIALMFEKDIQKQILQWLNQQPYTFCFKIAQGAFSIKGIPDILCCIKGKFVAFEIKRRGQSATKLQKYFIRRIIENGGSGFIVYSLAEVKKIWEELNV